MSTDLLATTNTLEKNEKQLHTAMVEMSKMRTRIIKLKRRRHVNIDEKICKLCGQEYAEKENFNWSCRTHASKWSDVMWWCCGETSYEAPGCRSQKHQSKEDEEEEEDILNEEKQMQDGVVCACCKQKGHQMSECPNDPNFRTKHSLNGEVERIENL